MRRADMQLKRDVEDELRRDHRVNAALIGVGVSEGAVSLIGVVDSYAAKWAAEAATRRVPGVQALAHELRVRSLPNHRRSISELSAVIEGALGSRVEVPGTATLLRRHAAEDAKAIGNAPNATRSAPGTFEVVDQLTGLAVIV